MSRIKVVIIEDEFFVANQLSDLISSLDCDVNGVYHSGETFLQETDWNFDVAVVDIFLSESLTGLDVGKELSARNIPFLFLTANQDEITLREAANLKPKTYLTKPFQKIDVIAAIEIIRTGLTPNIQIRKNNGVEELNPNSIYFIKGDSGYVEIFYEKGKVVQRKLMKELLEELPENFVRVHRSYVVNKLYVESRNSKNCVVQGEVIPISRGFKDQLK
jgi:DNA-binding LytR/AlgR family response regulator